MDTGLRFNLLILFSRKYVKDQIFLPPLPTDVEVSKMRITTTTQTKTYYMLNRVDGQV